MSNPVCRFGAFRLVPDARELWNGDELVHLTRRAFDCLEYLVAHRDRAVGRDELVAALWGRVDASDSQVNQVVLRARLAVGDDGQGQRMIRTVPGFGYRWIVPIESDGESSTAAATPDPAPPDPAPPAPSDAVVETVAPSTPPSVTPARSRRRFALAAFAALVLLAATFAALLSRRVPPPTVAASASALVVLPFEVNAPRESAWVRLGAMDLVADRLRTGGLTVSPSDNVVSALHAIGEPVDEARLARLQSMLGAAVVVNGIATKSANGWRVELATVDADGTRHRESSEHADVTQAARRAADLLLAARGSPQSPSAGEGDDVQDLLQQGQAALLANELDTARRILSSAPEPARSDVRVRAKLAQIDFRAGKIAQAQAALDALLADPALASQPRAHAQVLTTRGFIAIRREECAVAEASFGNAVGILQDAPATRERDVALAARGLARACLHRFDAAMDDLGLARSRLEAAGDRLGIARVNNYLGVLETERNRLADALPYFMAAADTNEAFGVVEALRANLSAALVGQAQLLRWSDALATSERMWKLRDRLRDPELLAGATGLRARVLIGVGRYREADELLAGAARDWPDAHGESSRFLHEARAELALRRGQPEPALVAVAAALAALPADPARAADDRARLLLWRQRASIAAGRPAAVATETADAPGRTAHLVAAAEWADHEGRDADAETAFRAALSVAGANAVPDEVALAVQAYAGWLLAHGRGGEAGAAAGRVGAWADRDFDCALLQAMVHHATGQTDAWRRALDQARALAGERPIPAVWLEPPASR